MHHSATSARGSSQTTYYDDDGRRTYVVAMQRYFLDEKMGTETIYIGRSEMLVPLMIAITELYPWPYKVFQLGYIRGKLLLRCFNADAILAGRLCHCQTIHKAGRAEVQVLYSTTH